MARPKTKNLAKRAIAQALAQFIGYGKKYTADCAATKLYCTPESISNWKCQKVTASMAEFFEQCMLFGPEYVNLVLSHIGMGGAHYLNAKSVDLNRLHADLSMLDAHLAVSRADGHVDHREQQQLADLLTTFMPCAEAFLKAHSHGPRLALANK